MPQDQRTAVWQYNRKKSWMRQDGKRGENVAEATNDTTTQQIEGSQMLETKAIGERKCRGTSILYDNTTESLQKRMTKKQNKKYRRSNMCCTVSYVLNNTPCIIMVGFKIEKSKTERCFILKGKEGKTVTSS